MEFAWNTEKNRMNDVKGKEMEQDRKGKISNEEIDLDKTHLNYDLVESNQNLYQRVKQRVEEVRAVSRVQKNSVVDYSNIITVPKEQSEDWGIDKTKDYFKEVYNYFCKEFGKENVVSAKIHLDETTPHMHLHFVPINQENGKLQARILMNPTKISKIHTEAPEYLRSKGFEVFRGEGKTDKSLDIHKYKATKLKEEIEALERHLGALENVNSNISSLNTIKTKTSLIGSNVTISKYDYEKLVDLSKNSIYSNYTKAKVDALQSEISRMSKDKNMLNRENAQLKHNLSREQKKLSNINALLKTLSPEFKFEYNKAVDKFVNAPKQNKVISRNIER